MHAAAELLVWLHTQACSPSKPYVVAIDGYAGAGKSTLAAWLHERIQSSGVVCLDDFYGALQAPPMPTHTDESFNQAVNDYFSVSRCIADVLYPLTQGKAARWQPVEWLTHRPSRSKTLAPCAFIILEGVFASHPLMAPYVDTLVMVTTPLSTRHQRVLARPQPDTQWFDHWQACEHWFHTTYATALQADWVIGGSLPPK